MPHDDSIRDEAAAWAVRTGDPAFEDWDGFTAWLERDAAHAEAYDRASLAVAEAAEALASAPANDAAIAAPRGNRRWFGAALAACLAGLAAVGVWQMGGDGRVYETAPGETRSIALGDGSTIELAGGSRITVDEDDPRFARLESGQALFDIRHDDAHPFRLEAGDDTLVDVGTVFDVRLDAENLAVAVSEGVVLFNPAQQNVRLEPGDRLTSARDSADYVLSEVPLAQVGEWREGRLTFADADLADVVADLARATGVPYRVAPGSAVQPVSGSVVVAPLRGNPAALGPLLGVSVRKAGEDWMVEAP
ncbi:FecR domain-containing protein [Pelagerythrobacter sp.]|uniref:FecR family protein n=1 Tax=Pelagerythrobacter sp. TaxID=2800702 RepID=UPI0035AEE485